jgi:hypothetical protein
MAGLSEDDFEDLMDRAVQLSLATRGGWGKDSVERPSAARGAVATERRGGRAVDAGHDRVVPGAIAMARLCAT